MDGKNYLLAIAIDSYKYYSRLNNAVKDVEEIIGILTSLYQFDNENIYKLLNEEATEDGIDEKFLQLVDSITENDNLVVFYSGHGYYRENVKEGYWVPVNGRKDKVSDYITNANLIRYLQNIKAHHLLMIVDSCFSGALVEQLKGNPTSERFPSRRVFASGRTEVSDGLPGENSPFAKGIIDFLKANLEKVVSTTALIDSVRTYVDKGDDGQMPVEGRLKDSKDNRGEFFFKRKLTEEEFWTATLAKDTYEAYQEYLNVYQEGRFSSLAIENYRKKITQKAWDKAIQGNTIDDYEDFIDLHPESDLVDQANAKIALLKKAELSRREAEAERMKRLREQKREEEEVEGCKEKYRKSALEGDGEMAKKNFRQARKKYWECEEFFKDGFYGFIPDIQDIRGKRELCTRELLFHEYAEDGKRDYRIRNYTSALQFFLKALEIKPNDEEIERLKNAASTLLKAKGSVDIPTKGETNNAIKIRSGAIKIKVKDKEAASTQPASKPAIRVKKNPDKKAPARVVLPTVYSDVVEKKHSGFLRRLKNAINNPDFTFLWIFLLALAYLILLVLFNVM